jgi:suppressor for copper-sensitivity B
VVFVDVTADWCVTCQANKKLVLDQQPVAGRLKDGGVVAMQADWTNPDPKIADFLGRHGRYGIPFNIVYGPGAPAGIVLPELLTADAVNAALDQAAKP